MKHTIKATLFLLILSAGWATAAVADASANGFTLKTTLDIQAAPDEVYSRLIRVGDWWDSEHTYSGNSHNLTIEEKPMGCFCEKLPNQGGVRHMEVVFLAPGKTLVMVGGLGPLQSIGAAGSLRVQLTPAGAGTKLEVIYAVAGYLPAGLNTWAAGVDSVLTQQFTRLKNYIERGDPAPKADTHKER